MTARWAWLKRSVTLGICAAALPAALVGSAGATVLWHAPPTEAENASAPQLATFTNSATTAVAPSLAENYVDFSFNYPADWTIDPKTGTEEAINFVKVIRPRAAGDIDTETFAVGYFTGTGMAELDAVLIPQLLDQLKEQFARGFPNFAEIDRGATEVNGLAGQQFRFQSTIETGENPIHLWGRVVLLPPEKSKTGVTLVMLATDRAPEIKSIDDLGTAGRMPVILSSFRIGA